MKTIFEEYGDFILQFLGGIAVIALIVDLIRTDGLLHQLLVQLVESAC